MRALLALLALSAAAAEAQVPVTLVDTVWVQPTAYARSLAFSRDGALVASGGKRGGPASAPRRIALWAAPDGALVDEFLPIPGSSGSLLAYTNGLAFSGDGTHLVSTHGTIDCYPNGPCGPSETYLIRWAVPDLAVVAYRQLNTLLPTAVQFSPDGADLAVGYANGEIRIHDQVTLASLALLNAGESSNVSVEYSPDGALIASAGSESVVRIWNAASGALLRTLDHSTSSSNLEEPISVAFSPDGQTLVTGLGEGGGGGFVTVWRVADGAQLLQIDVRNVPGFSVSNTLVEVSPNGEYVIAAVSEEFSPTPGTYRTTNRLRLYDIDTGSLVADYDAGTIEDVRVGGFVGLALSPGQDHQIAYSLRGSLTVVDTSPLRMAGNPVASAPAPGAGTSLRVTGPNPLRTATTLALDVATAASVRAEAFDALGRRVGLLYDGPVAPGQTVPLPVDAARWPAGVYTVRVTGAAAPLTTVLTVVR